MTPKSDIVNDVVEAETHLTVLEPEEGLADTVAENAAELSEAVLEEKQEREIPVEVEIVELTTSVKETLQFPEIEEIPDSGKTSEVGEVGSCLSSSFLFYFRMIKNFDQISDNSRDSKSFRIFKFTRKSRSLKEARSYFKFLIVGQTFLRMLFNNKHVFHARKRMSRRTTAGFASNPSIGGEGEKKERKRLIAAIFHSN